MLKISALWMLIGFVSVAQAQTETKISPLFAAVNKTTSDEVSKLIAAGEDVNVTNEGGTTPLTVAAWNGNLPMVKFLLEHDADPDLAEDKVDAGTPLTAACYQGSMEIVKMLIAYGANPQKSFKAGIPGVGAVPKYPINVAGDGGHGDIVDYLNKVINEWEYPKTPHVVRSLIEWGEIAKARDAINSDFGVGGHDAYGRTTLMVAAHSFYYDRIIGLAIDHGADVNAKDKKGRTLLHHFAMSRSDRADGIKDCIKKHKLNVNEADNGGDTPLLLAAWACTLENIEPLLEAGADVNHKNNVGNTAVAVALRRADAERTQPAVEILLKNGANVNIANSEGITPLHVAIWKGHGSCADMLLNAGANVNASAAGWTPLHQAAACDNEEVAVEMVGLILSKKPTNINEKSNGKTPLSIAKGNGYTKCASLIQEAGGTE